MIIITHHTPASHHIAFSMIEKDMTQNIIGPTTFTIIIIVRFKLFVMSSKPTKHNIMSINVESGTEK